MSLNYEEKQENLICIDWVSFTSKIHTPQEIITLLGMESASWELIKGMHGYKQRLYSNCISIHFDGQSDMGVWCEMSGQGCRAYETIGNGDYDYLFAYIMQHQPLRNMNLTRIDVAFDDHVGIFPLETRMTSDYFADNFVSKWDIARLEHSKKNGTCNGVTIYHGSRSSQAMLRIYDKAKERGYTDRHWVRAELQLRDERAQGFVETVQKNHDFGGTYYGVIANYLRYVIPDDSDSNKWRWNMTRYWKSFIKDSTAIKIYTKPGMEYNLFNLNRFLIHQAGGAIKTFIDIFGVDYLAKRLSDVTHTRNDKYERLKNDVAVMKELNPRDMSEYLTKEDLKLYKAYFDEKYPDEKNKKERFKKYWDEAPRYDEIIKRNVSLQVMYNQVAWECPHHIEHFIQNFKNHEEFGNIQTMINLNKNEVEK